MNKHQAAIKLTEYLKNDNLDKYFTFDTHTLLSENLRCSRRSNKKKYGKLDYYRDSANRVYFSSAVIEDLYINKIKLIALNKKRELDLSKIKH